MPAIVFDLIVLVGLAYLAWLASAMGLYLTTVASLEVFVSLVTALLLYEPIASFLTPLLIENLGVFLPESVSLQAWAVFLSFTILMWVTFFVLWTVVHPKVATKEIATLPPIDQGVGAVVGWFGGMLFLGAIMITWSMFPFNFLRIPAQHMFLDVGKTALRTAGVFAGERHEGKSLVLYGEPASRESVGSARLASETWYDTDGNNTHDDHDPYFDSDANGSFTKDLYYEDVDTDRLRRVGLLEKYTVSRWDNQVIVGNRERPKKEPPKAKPPVPPPAAAVTEPAAAEVPPPGTAIPAPPDAAPTPAPPPPPPPGDDF
jgi:hypothetical protein